MYWREYVGFVIVIVEGAEIGIVMQKVSNVKMKKDKDKFVRQKRFQIFSVFYAKSLVHWQRNAFWIIMVLAAFLRLYQFPGTPAGMWVDETTEGLDAYALLQHGTDRWGNPFPFYFPGGGSGQNVLQAYLSIPFIKIFGLSIFSIRIVPVLMGIFAVALLYLTLKKIYGINTALLGAFLIATLPWYMMASRWGIESNLFPSFSLLSICTLLYSYNSPRRWLWIPFSLIPMAITFYAYGTSIIPIPIFLILFVVFNRKTILQEKVRFLLSLFIFLLIATPFFLYVLENDVLHQQLEFLTHLPFTIPYLSANRLNQVNKGLSTWDILIANLHFFIGGYHDQWIMNSISWVSPLGWLVPPFAGLGVYFSLKRRQLASDVVVLWLAAIVPEFVLFVFTVHRSNGLYIPLVALGAYGIVSLLECVQSISTRKVVTAILLIMLTFSNVVFYLYYFTDYNNDSAVKFTPGYDQALASAVKLAHPNELIYTPSSSSYAYTLFYLRADMKDFYTHADIEITKDGSYDVLSYGRYFFTSFLPPVLANASSYVAILNDDNTISCQREQIFYQDTTWSHDHWLVERCFPYP